MHPTSMKQLGIFLLMISLLSCNEKKEDKNEDIIHLDCEYTALGIPENLPELVHLHSTSLRNILSIAIRDDGSIVFENEDFSLDGLQQETYRYLTNNGRNPNYSDSFQRAVVVIIVHEEATYGSYLDVLDKVKDAFIQIREEDAMRTFGMTFSELRDSSESDYKYIIKKFPIKIIQKGIGGLAGFERNPIPPPPPPPIR